MASRRRFHWLKEALRVVEPQASDPDARAHVDELYRALDDLPAEQRIPWSLHVIEGQTLEETARLCDVSLATVKRRIADAAALIRNRLDAK
jgi:RNA polymerase sigma-70 factor (ECF subfamily)